MYVRITSATGVTDIDRAVEIVRDRVLPELQKQHGFRGVSASGARATTDLVVLSLWDTEADLNASESTADKVRHETMTALGANATVERFEQAYQQIGAVPPGPGSKLQVRRVTVDVSRLEENLEYFRSTVAPALSATPGFQGVRQLINRRTGEGAVGIVWADDASLQTATAAGEERRRQAAERGVEFGEMAIREILFASMP